MKHLKELIKTTLIGVILTLVIAKMLVMFTPVCIDWIHGFYGMFLGWILGVCVWWRELHYDKD